ncbi:alpha/beta fold hydrolase [Pedobacter gandavensis]|uniref:Alpha/beta fold hydrolase n=1 Tax=Pedobacter gandavensis TaxID=2679963 RepID=A0ABR6EUX3_9SPHI|nr:alpha/beta hydrolase [Pedobacter gandavensis]MBB2149061.1 alpha/beta fold hydrolase [Pedobacter gandavensis]
MLKLKLNIFAILFLATSINTYGQFFEIYQAVNVEKHKGKNFSLEGKIFYKDAITNSSWTVLAARSLNDKGQQQKATLYNDNASDYYKNGEWSPYELTGKIEKDAKYLGIGITVAGIGSYYVDDLKLFVKDGKDKIEIPMQNSGFENDSLTNWKSYNLDKNTKLILEKDIVSSGKQSLFIDNSSIEVAPKLGNNSKVGKYATINGIKLYYEIYGQGEPLLLLHGNNSSIGSFDNQLDVLSKKYMVIGLDSRGQGKSTGDTTKLTYELMAEDLNAFLEQLQLKNTNVLGWSDGGNIALILAMRHPDKVKKMAVMGTVLFNDERSVTAETNKLIRKQVKEMQEKGVAETNMDYRLKMLLLTEPNINPDALQKIQSPTLVMAGQHDVVKEKHTKLIAEKIPGSKLMIFKGADHEAPKKIPQLFNQTVLDFFEPAVK